MGHGEEDDDEDILQENIKYDFLYERALYLKYVTILDPSVLWRRVGVHLTLKNDPVPRLTCHLTFIIINNKSWTI